MVKKIAMVFFLLIIYGQCFAESKVSSISIITPEWNNWTNPNGTGLYFELVKLIYAPSGIKMKFSFAPYKRAMYSVDRKQFDAMFGIYSSESEKAYNFLTPQYPIAVERIAIVFKKSLLKKWEGQKSIENRNVVWIRGYGYDEHLSVKVKSSNITRGCQGLAMLELGRTDFFMTAYDELDQDIRNSNIDISQYRIEILCSKNLYMGFADTPKGRQLVEIFNKRMPALISTGKIQNLFKEKGITYIDLKPCN